MAWTGKKTPVKAWETHIRNGKERKSLEQAENERKRHEKQKNNENNNESMIEMV